MSTAVRFGRMIRNARETKNISQEKLARELKLSRISINNYEQGKQAPNLDTAIKLAHYLDIQLDDLVQAVDTSSLEYALDELKNKDKNFSHQLKDVLKTIGGDDEYKKS